MWSRRSSTVRRRMRWRRCSTFRGPMSRPRGWTALHRWSKGPARTGTDRLRDAGGGWLALPVTGAAALFLGASIGYLVPAELRAQAPAPAKTVAGGPNKALEHGF